MHIRTPVGDSKAIMWDAPPEGVDENPMFPKLGEILSITDFKDDRATFGSIKINKLGFVRLDSKDDLPEDIRYIAEPPKASEQDLKDAWGIICDLELWSHKRYATFIKKCLAHYGKKLLETSPAATGVHHTYQGGLLVHTAEVLELCKAQARATHPKYNFINTDVLFAAAILHDIGKVDTYRINEIGIAESLPNERIIGHMFYAMYLVRHVGEELEMDKQWLEEVMHCIASHHGQKEWGSYKECQSIEAGILSRVDYVSSRDGMMEKRLQEYIQRESVDDEFKIYGDNYFNSLGIQDYIKRKVEEKNQEPEE